MASPSTTAQHGLTILEILIVSSIGLMLIAALLRFLVAGYPISKVTFLQANSNETARVQLKRITQQLREVRTSDAGSYALVEMDPHKLIFYANVDADSAVERVRYELVGTELVRGIVNPSGEPITYDVDTEQVTVIAKSIQNGSTPMFVYYNGDYPDDQTSLTPVDVTDVKYIQFYLVVDSNPNIDPAPVEVRSQVQLRNLKTNLGQTT